MSTSPFLRSLREHMLVRRYSLRTVKSYSYWIKSFILFHGKVHPTELGGTEVEVFLREGLHNLPLSYRFSGVKRSNPQFISACRQPFGLLQAHLPYEGWYFSALIRFVNAERT